MDLRVRKLYLDKKHFKQKTKPKKIYKETMET